MTKGCHIPALILFYNLTKRTMIKTILFTAIATMTITCGNAQTKSEMTAKKIKIRNSQVEINYYQQGTGDTTLLFLHGWCIDGTYWQNQLNHFSKQYNALAIDLAGFGKSTANRRNWTIEEYAEDVNSFIDSLHLRNVVLIGHSMSGSIMLQTAMLKNPNIIGLVGVDNFKVLDVEFTPEQMKQMTDFYPMLQNDFKNSAPIYADMMLFHQMTPQDIKNRVKNDFANTDPIIGYGTLMNFMQYSVTEAQKLERLELKLNLLNGNSFPTNEAGLQNHCKKGFKVETISDTGHYPMIEKPEEFNKKLENILDIK